MHNIVHRVDITTGGTLDLVPGDLLKACFCKKQQQDKRTRNLLQRMFESLLSSSNRQKIDLLKQTALDQVSNVVGQLLNDSVVEPLNVLQQPLIILDDKVDCNSLAPKPARPSNPTQNMKQLCKCDEPKFQI